jgi:hypothetical protein
VRGQFRKLLIGIAGMAAGALAALAWSSLFFGDPGVWLDFFPLTASPGGDERAGGNG